MKAAIGLAALALAGCATPHPEPGPTAQPELIAYETNSWGRVVSGWTIGPHGGGSWYERVNESGQPGPVGPYAVRHHDFEVGPQGFAELAALLEQLPDPAPGADGCAMFRTDDLYGALRLTSGATTTEIAYNQGCMDPPYRAFMQQLRAADALVAGWGKAAPVARSQRYGADGMPLAGK